MSAPRTATLEPAYGGDGLIPAIVQDGGDGRVLMLAWVDAEALAATVATGEVHFHSRSRDRLWRKGETSGNVLRLRDMALDCDSDALLITVEAVGPTCHRGTRSCFDLQAAAPARASTAGTASAATDREPAVGSVGSVGSVEGFGWLETLWTTIADRAATRPPGSYTTSLLDAGVDVTARKVTEEATEVLIAAKDDAAAETTGSTRATTQSALAAETADLLYHSLVLLAERGLPPSDVIRVLRERHTG